MYDLTVEASIVYSNLVALTGISQFDGMDAGRYEFARDRFLSIRTLQGIASLKRQLLEALSQAGLCASGLRASYVESLGRRADVVLCDCCTLRYQTSSVTRMAPANCRNEGSNRAPASLRFLLKCR